MMRKPTRSAIHRPSYILRSHAISMPTVNVSHFSYINFIIHLSPIRQTSQLLIRPITTTTRWMRRQRALLPHHRHRNNGAQTKAINKAFKKVHPIHRESLQINSIAEAPESQPKAKAIHIIASPLTCVCEQKESESTDSSVSFQSTNARFRFDVSTGTQTLPQSRAKS